MLSINPVQVPELKAHHLENQDLRKRAKFLRKCKQATWNRWSCEFVRCLREHHVNAAGKQATSYPGSFFGKDPGIGWSRDAQNLGNNTNNRLGWCSGDAIVILCEEWKK